MTSAARVTQADIVRTLKAIKAAGIEQARVVVDLANQRIEIFIGPGEQPSEPNPWDDEWSDLE